MPKDLKLKTYIRHFWAIPKWELIPESSTHLIFDCPKFNSLREQHKVFNRYKDMKTLLASNNVLNYNDLINFIKEAKFELYLIMRQIIFIN